MEARLAEGEPGLRGSRRTAGAPQRGTCEAPPIRHGFRRDTFPSGEGFFVTCARAGLPYGRPASPMLVRSDMVERGGDLLRRPTEATPAPPAMEPCGEMQLLGFVSCGNGWGSSPQTLAKEPSALWTLVRGNHYWAEARLAEGEPGLQGSRRTTGAPRRGACQAPPIRHGTAVTPSPPGKDFLVALGRGSPTVAPLRVRLARSAIGARGGDLLRRPTEATPAPPAMHRCGEPYRFRPVPPCQLTSRETPDKLTNPHATRAARRCRPAASGQQT